MSHTITAKVATPNGGKYVQQLCKHWSHKLETRVEGDTGTVTFPTAVATMTADGEGIAIAITGENRDDVEQLTDVVARHIDRFAFREDPLTYDWQWRETAAQ
ncbi:hypothetical protein EDF56_101608 [Novosphingobium sp. PhB165]|uniref:DUF2218 domain-containing protein n=1 Tax=Novosphingobium sp. PhB165 TaxID=2485105 RepID=UPI00104E5926|nr:DUF2218 domain-containing protein [Novosphingobium sp. PhB165]TCM21931.1 hypothetical protein EDF56_101608 [Novosphingobium sp. PhB165]